jgi:CBS domain-containing protein
MATLRDIIAAKGAEVWSVERDATVLQAVHQLNERHVGALIVTDQGQIVGIFSERDFLRRIIGEDRDAATTCVGDVMTAPLICCTMTTSIEDARTIMRDRRIRHLPMTDGDGRLLGMISIGDLNAHLLHAHEQTIHEMREYISGRT